MCLALVVLVTASTSLAQDQTEEELQKKYSAILGEFDSI
jgi:hypothetical protein